MIAAGAMCFEFRLPVISVLVTIGRTGTGLEAEPFRSAHARRWCTCSSANKETNSSSTPMSRTLTPLAPWHIGHPAHRILTRVRSVGRIT